MLCSSSCHSCADCPHYTHSFAIIHTLADKEKIRNGGGGRRRYSQEAHGLLPGGARRKSVEASNRKGGFLRGMGFLPPYAFPVYAFFHCRRKAISPIAAMPSNANVAVREPAPSSG